MRGVHTRRVLEDARYSYCVTDLPALNIRVVRGMTEIIGRVARENICEMEIKHTVQNVREISFTWPRKNVERDNNCERDIKDSMQCLKVVAITMAVTKSFIARENISKRELTLNI